MAILTAVEQEKIEEWLRYLRNGGLDRPIDAIPFAAIDLDGHREELLDLIANILVMTLLTDPVRAEQMVRELMAMDAEIGEVIVPLDKDAMGDDTPDNVLDEVSRMVQNAMTSVLILGDWHSGGARPMEPHHTLNKMIQDGKTLWDMSDSRLID